MHLKIKKIIKFTLLQIRGLFLLFVSIFTFSMRKKKLDKNKLEKVLVIALRRVGDAIVSIPTFRAIKENLPQSELTVFANSYAQDILERIKYIDNLLTYEKGASFFQKAGLMKKLSGNQYDLAVDLTCDYSLEGALLSYLSKAKYRVGYNIYRRGFLFNRAVKNENGSLHIINVLLNIVKSIDLDTQDNSLNISASPEAEEAVRQFLRERSIKAKDLLLGVHPGGYYPTQRWLRERFAAVADKVIERYKARVVLIGGPGEEEIISQIADYMKNKAIIFLDRPVKELLALIQFCHLLICNNSGPLHMATALGTPTVSTMGPTIPERWWPYGQEHIVLRKDLGCVPCNEGTCRIETFDCMRLITVEEMLAAVEKQIHNIVRIKKSWNER